jgi:hypothetical protein
VNTVPDFMVGSQTSRFFIVLKDGESILACFNCHMDGLPMLPMFMVHGLALTSVLPVGGYRHVSAVSLWFRLVHTHTGFNSQTNDGLVLV